MNITGVDPREARTHLFTLAGDAHCADCGRAIPRGTELQLVECPAGWLTRCERCAETPHVTSALSSIQNPTCSIEAQCFNQYMQDTSAENAGEFDRIDEQAIYVLGDDFVFICTRSSVELYEKNGPYSQRIRRDLKAQPQTMPPSLFAGMLGEFRQYRKKGDT